VFNILHDDDYVWGSQSHSKRKKKEAGHVITERRFILQEPGSAEFLPLKMDAVGFDKGKNMGKRAAICRVTLTQSPVLATTGATEACDTSKIL
jgi:hypothetical protein